MFILNVLLSITNNISGTLLAVALTIILYIWITMFINRDYKFIIDYNKKYKDRRLSIDDLENIRYEIEHMEGRPFDVFSEWLFKNMGKYKSVTLIPERNDEGRDLILADENNNTDIKIEIMTLVDIIRMIQEINSSKLLGVVELHY